MMGCLIWYVVLAVIVAFWWWAVRQEKRIEAIALERRRRHDSDRAQ